MTTHTASSSRTAAPHAPPARPQPRVRRRPLETPAPSVPLEKPVREAVAELAAARRGTVSAAAELIDRYGLTIEVARLRERLGQAPLSDVRRLLLSTPGVPEALFLEAVADAVPPDVVEENPVEEFAATVGTADTLADRLQDALLESMGQALLGVLTDARVAGSLSSAIAEALRTASPSSAGSGSQPGGPGSEPVATAEPGVPSVPSDEQGPGPDGDGTSGPPSDPPHGTSRSRRLPWNRSEGES